MKIIDLTPELEPIYFCCLEDWSDDIREAGNHKECWYNQMKHKGLRVKLAKDDDGSVCGMIQYLPVEYSFAEGKDLYMILCIWVHGHKQGVGNHQKKGIGKSLLAAAESDAAALGAKGIAAWGLILPFFMRASWFRKNGYKVADRDGIARLMWKQFTPDAAKPSFIKFRKKPDLVPGKVNISLFLNGWCPAQNIVHERTKRAMEGFEDKIVVNDIRTNDKEVIREWGLSDAVFIDNRSVRTGPPEKYNKIRRLVEKRVARLNK
ncbi:MAG: GNAT family N-acetyltransferase [Bacteroidales bacterium]